MTKYAISRQNPHIGIGTESGHRYPLYIGELVPVPKVGVPVPIHSEGMVPVPIKVVLVSILPTTLFLYPLHC